MSQKLQHAGFSGKVMLVVFIQFFLYIYISTILYKLYKDNIRTLVVIGSALKG